MKKRVITFDNHALEQVLYWTNNDLKMLRKIFKLIENIQKTPFAGIGKPEALKYMDGYWSRRIDDAHRLVYKVSAEQIIIASCKSHYEEK